MASPYSYSGPAMATGAIGNAISDMFTGMLEGESNKAKTELQAEQLANMRFQAEKEKAFLPYEAKRMQLGVEQGEQGLEKGALDIASTKEELSQRPTLRGRETWRFGAEQAKEGREAETFGWSREAAERTKVLYERQQDALKKLPLYMEQGDKGIASWLLQYGDVVKNPMVNEFGKQWLKQQFPDPRVGLWAAREQEALAKAAYWIRRPDAGPLSAEDKEGIRQTRAELSAALGNLKQIEADLTRGGKPVDGKGVPYTKESVGRAKAEIIKRHNDLSRKLNGESANVTPRSADELWGKVFGEETLSEEGMMESDEDEE